MKRIKWVLIAGVVLCIFIGAYFAGKMFSTSPVQSTQNRRNNTVQSSSQTNSSSESSRSSDSLDYNTITPMQTAAAIAYYGDHDVHKGVWKGLFSSYSDLEIYQEDNADHLKVKGRGNSWILRPSNMNGGAMAIYTVGSDGEVAFYNANTRNEDKDKDPVATANLRDIIADINNKGAAGQIKDKAQHIHLQSKD
ncbi:hypothetical protein [Limosilactobacillus coleohominis]|uniref:hypothetical protein n=1 Tax=Limosilactobacillus coleohominis TaxID=181675 RepID=UPI0019564722|nr:hypothetical protein [Limosilactobacillus coleohominis]MBM6955249.1 hypothetical protein [Limosilactobacillus coleohominis]